MHHTVVVPTGGGALRGMMMMVSLDLCGGWVHQDQAIRRTQTSKKNMPLGPIMGLKPEGYLAAELQQTRVNGEL